MHCSHCTESTFIIHVPVNIFLDWVILKSVKGDEIRMCYVIKKLYITSFTYSFSTMNNVTLSSLGSHPSSLSDPMVVGLLMPCEQSQPTQLCLCPSCPAHMQGVSKNSLNRIVLRFKEEERHGIMVTLYIN